MRIRRAVGYAVVFIASFLMAMLFQHWVAERRPQATPAKPSILSIQDQREDIIKALKSIEALELQTRTSSWVIVSQLQRLPLQGRSVTGFVEKPFLYDGVRPQDLERMNPPRRVPGLAVPLPPNEFKKQRIKS